jgi:translation initiation factor IF-3
MPSSQCVFNPATALRRVFMPSNVGTPRSLHLTRIFVPALLALPPQARAYWASPGHGARQPPSRHSPSIFDRDSYARPTSSNSLAGRRVVRQAQQKKEDADAQVSRVPVKLGRMPRDNEINWPYVYVKMAGDHEPLGTPRPIKEVLAELDRNTTYLEAIVVPNPRMPDSPKWPICKIVNRKEELAKQKQLKERKKKSAVKEKEIELSWTLASHDLDHKLKSLQKFLGKGYKVQVLLQKKVRGKATANEGDAKAIVDRIDKAVGEVKGAKEWKRREGELLGSYRIFLQGKAADHTATASSAAAEETATTSSDATEEEQTAIDDAVEESEESSTRAQSQA